MSRLKFRTEEARKRERTKLLFKISFIVVILLILFGGVFFACHQDFLRIKNIYVQTDGILTEEEVASTVQAELNGMFFGVVPKNSIFLLRNTLLEEKVKESFPRVSHVNIRRAGLYTLSVSVEERVPDALWCGDVVPPVAYEKTLDADRTKEELWGTCYLVDQKGYIYAKAPIYSGNVFPRYYGSLKNAEPIAQQFISEEDFIAWQKFYASLKRDDVFPQALLFVDERDIEVYLSNGLRILVPREEGPDATHERLISLLESDSIDITREVEYVDFRFGSKVFVKYWKEEE